MTSMVTRSAAKGGPLRRAWISAWIVTIVMGGTTMAFQVYRSVRFGHMPWPLAWLEGIVPLLIAILVLEIVAEWKRAPLAADIGAYLIMGGAMYWSASATAAVVLRASPPHSSLLFGVLLDGAELLAAYFIMNGPRAADATAQGAAEAAAEAERRAAHEAALSAERDARTAAEAALAPLTAELATARTELGNAYARAETLARKLEAATGRNRRAATARKSPAATGRKSEKATGPETAPVTAPEGPEAPDDLDSEAKVLWYLDKGYSASKAGTLAGLTDSRGRQIARLKKTAPADAVDGGQEPG
jgi:hypothetical protein